MLLDHLLAEVIDRAQVLADLYRNAHRNESARGVVIGEQLAIGNRDRTEESRLAVADRLHLLCLKVVAEDIRYTGVIRRAIEITSVAREDEVRRDVVVELVNRFEVRAAALQRIGIRFDQLRAAGDVDQRRDKRLPIR